MGIEDLLWNKARKTLNELGSNEEENLVNNDEIEKASYSEASYKKVQKLREKGKYWGLDVPYLQHPVKKQEKPRPMFIALGVLYAIMFALVFAGSVALTINFIVPMISSALAVSSSVQLFVWDIFGIVAALTALGPIFLWIIIVSFVTAIVLVNVFFAFQTVHMFKMSKISMQEMAVGHEVQGMLLRLGTIIGITLVVCIAIWVLTRETISTQGILFLVGIMVAVSAVVGTIFGLLLVQKLKAKKEFDQLPEEQRNDFIRHNRELDRVRRQKGKSKSMIGSSKVDF